MRELILGRATLLFSVYSSRGHFEKCGDIFFWSAVVISLISVCKSDELVEVIGHACVFIGIVNFHLNSSFGFFFNHLHKDVMLHLLSQGWPS